MNESELKNGLSVDAQMIADIIGIDLTVKLIIELGGVTVYIPKVSNVLLRRLNESGATVKELSELSGLKNSQIVKSLETVKDDGDNDGLTETTRILSEIIGFDAVVKLTFAWGGSSLYIPKANHGIIREVYQTTNLHPMQIAAKCGCCMRTVYRSIEGLPPRDPVNRKNWTEKTTGNF